MSCCSEAQRRTGARGPGAAVPGLRRASSRVRPELVPRAGRGAGASG